VYSYLKIAVFVDNNGDVTVLTTKPFPCTLASRLQGSNIFLNRRAPTSHMTEGQTVEELLWGSQACDRYWEILRMGKSATPQEAGEVLHAIVHAEVREPIDNLEAQMVQGAGVVTYTPFKKDPKGMGFLPQTFLFSDSSYTGGLYLGIVGLLEAAHPEYAFVGCPVGTIALQKKAVLAESRQN